MTDNEKKRIEVASLYAGIDPREVRTLFPEEVKELMESTEEENAHKEDEEQALINAAYEKEERRKNHAGNDESL